MIFFSSGRHYIWQVTMLASDSLSLGITQMSSDTFSTRRHLERNECEKRKSAPVKKGGGKHLKSIFSCQFCGSRV